MISMPSSAARRRSAPFSTLLETMCAKGSPGATSPSKVRNTGRTGSVVRESVTIISVIACACGAISSQQPSRSSMRLAAAAIADARVSFCHKPAGAASTTATARFDRACFSETAVASPT
jgi:hypothetical protein